MVSAPPGLAILQWCAAVILITVTVGFVILALYALYMLVSGKVTTEMIEDAKRERENRHKK